MTSFQEKGGNEKKLKHFTELRYYIKNTSKNDDMKDDRDFLIPSYHFMTLFILPFFLSDLHYIQFLCFIFVSFLILSFLL